MNLTCQVIPLAVEWLRIGGQQADLDALDLSFDTVALDELLTIQRELWNCICELIDSTDWNNIMVVLNPKGGLMEAFILLRLIIAQKALACQSPAYFAELCRDLGLVAP
jgi:hypothetical protein